MNHRLLYAAVGAAAVLLPSCAGPTEPAAPAVVVVGCDPALHGRTLMTIGAAIADAAAEPGSTVGDDAVTLIGRSLSETALLVARSLPGPVCSPRWPS